MLIALILNLIVATFGIVFSWLPQVTTLPIIFGFDTDGAMVTGMGQFNTLASSVWALQYLFNGFLFIVAYFILKIILKFFLGSRTPVN
jgi:hypothetical protein